MSKRYVLEGECSHISDAESGEGMKIPPHTCPIIDKAIAEIDTAKHHLGLAEDLIEKLRQANSELRECAEYWKAEAHNIAAEIPVWLPIAEAPKDGTRVLLYRPTAEYGMTQVFGKWEDNKYAKNPNPYWRHDWDGISGTIEARRNQPTHWQPLPKPPEGEK